ncbi:hypothetical protein OD91_2241 [Lutibacter sp. Hel_I_33_5]|uniref:helix-turn-helix domain-containing protein n=1 Tax=Lutibacter sp. Hel_I_33_5 TaxID=1566289 RepID=UPI0011A3BCC4|nr:helix-turn-helix domain-containing protein [Lutibacter sp. Hel_I_33_5]TVZ56939.1 hypothetical protein OD91_2241 [Lutibacter sp. Hel_I_33_5]
MRAIHNPYEFLINEVSELKKLLIEIKNSPKEDYTNKYYTYHQVAELLHVDYQSIRNYVNSGFLKAEEVGPRKKLIHHFQIFNEDQTLKNFKYKRKA